MYIFWFIQFEVLATLYVYLGEHYKPRRMLYIFYVLSWPTSEIKLMKKLCQGRLNKTLFKQRS